MAANPAGTEQPIIIKKKKGGHGGHHGGAWKVAYADFVTAMMAFFLLLWLLNVTTSDQRKGIADYFAPVSVSRETSGSGGMLGGQTITAPGAQINSTSPMTADVPSTPSPNGAGGEEPMSGAEEVNPGDQKPSENRLEYQQRLEQLAKQLGIPGQKAGERLTEFADRVSEATQQLRDQQSEGKQFQQAANEIRQAIQSIPELQPLAQNLMIDQTPEGLRIQIVDQDRVSMFPGGSGQMYPQTKQLVMQVAQALSKLPNKLSISGHTDSVPFSGGTGRDNWDLSAERANATRRALLAGGIPETRVQDVVGRADRDLLVPDQPGSPRNRRISIVLLRDVQQPKAPAGGGQPAKPQAAAPAPAPAPAASPAPARR